MNEEQLQLSTQILTDESKRWIEIYVIWNKLNGKCYIGQTVSHMAAHGRFIPHGHQQRFKDHIRNSKLDQDRQCRAIKNALNEFGPENFEVELLEVCSASEACDYEAFYMELFNSLEDGYNIHSSSRNTINTLEAKQARSKGTQEVAKEPKYERFKNVKEYKDMFYHIRVSYRNDCVFGWFVYKTEKIKADFAGVHIPLIESYRQSLNFLYTLKRRLVDPEAQPVEFGKEFDQEIRLSMLLTIVMYYKSAIKKQETKRNKAYKNPDPKLAPAYLDYVKELETELSKWKKWKNNKRNTLMREVPKALATTLSEQFDRGTRLIAEPNGNKA